MVRRTNTVAVAPAGDGPGGVEVLEATSAAIVPETPRTDSYDTPVATDSRTSDEETVVGRDRVPTPCVGPALRSHSMRLVPVVLSGGSGTRLWPMSRASLPKQFVDLGDGSSLFASTLQRVAALPEISSPVIVANQAHVGLIETVLKTIAITPISIIAEPVGRNTAPAIAIAALTLEPEDVMLVTPADSAIGDETAYQAAIATGLGPSEAGYLVTFGVVPDRAETGYGYIEASDPDSLWSPIVRFVEKPDEETAQRYLESGRFLWNAGVFMFPVGAVLAELEANAPEVLVSARLALESASRRGLAIALGAEFANSPAVSIDNAVMESTDKGVVVPLDAGWSDVGSWLSVWDQSVDAPDENVTIGQVVLHDVAGSYVRGADRPIAVVGLDNVVVVDTGDALLIAAKDRSQDVKAILDRLPPEVL